MKTYSLLKQLIFHQTDSQMRMVEDFLREMSFNEFREIPFLIISEDTKKVLETYACVIYLKKKNNEGVESEYTIYFVGSSIFKAIT